MRTGRQKFLADLESVSAGLSNREIIQQSTCFVFRDGKLVTFNDEIACSKQVDLGISGAVKAKPLIDLLSKMQEDEVVIEQGDNEVVVKGKKKKAGIRLEEEVLLPVDSVDTPTDFIKLSDEWDDAVSAVHSCASKDESQFVLTCIHITSNYVEATDRYQVSRYPLEIAGMGEMLVKAETLHRSVGLGLVEFAETDSWLHLRNQDGLVFSCRKWKEDYVDLTGFLDHGDVKSVVLPGGLQDIVAKAEIFSSDRVEGNSLTVDLRKDSVVISGEGAFGWYRELREVVYAGDPIRFQIAPDLLVKIVSKSSECYVLGNRICVDTGKFVYTSATELLEGIEV
jgi:DNA polymerase III sliding clamp (beta) subunit (PCNA family)